MLNSLLPSASGDISRARATLRLTGASAIHVRGMDKLTVDAVREIEQIHSSWIEFEVAGEDHSLMALCDWFACPFRRFRYSRAALSASLSLALLAAKCPSSCATQYPRESSLT